MNLVALPSYSAEKVLSRLTSLLLTGAVARASSFAHVSLALLKRFAVWSEKEGYGYDRYDS
ncbi:TPA: hypothetical protein I8634_000255 [Citrobacter freundii]|nr:hypothetical protein [Citrobacter freundii]HED2383468.1 hypothetical protein [Citrobacter freundii]